MKKIISCLILCAMLLSVFPMSVFAGGETDNSNEVSMTTLYDPTADTQTLDLTGYTAGTHVFTISSEDEMVYFNVLISNDAKKNFEGFTVRLKSDIDLSNKTWKKNSYFAGTFDGEGHTISGLTMTNGRGLFGYAVGTISNFTLAGASITNTDGGTGAIVGDSNNAIFKGMNLTISNVHVVNSNVSGTAQVGGIIGSTNDSADDNNIVTITNCSFIGTVAATKNRVGGIIGYGVNTTKINIIDCYVKGEIVSTYNTQGSTGSETSVGGIIGQSKVTTTISGTTCDAIYVHASTDDRYVGGVIGQISGNAVTATINDSIITGTVDSKSHGGGGLIAHLGDGADADIDRCYIDIIITGAGNHKGGIIARSTTGITTGGDTDINIKDCLVKGSINTSTGSNTWLAGIISWINDQSNFVTTVTCENIIVDVSSEHEKYAALTQVNQMNATSPYSYSNVYYNSKTWSGTAMFNDKHTTPTGTAYGAKTTEEINALTLTGWNDGMPVTLTYTDTNGVQCKDNEDGTVDYRVVGTLTLPAGKTLENIADIGFYVTFTYKKQTVMQKVSCKKVYSSIKGGGITYYAGDIPESDTDESHEYIGGDYIFVLVIENVPKDVALEARFTSYVNVSNTNGCDAYHEVTEIHTLQKN